MQLGKTREIKGRIGADFPVQYRFGLKHYTKGLNAGALSGEHYTEAGRDVEEGLEMAKLLEEAGFSKSRVYWEEYEESEDEDDDELEGTGKYYETTEVENQESWMIYIVAEK